MTENSETNTELPAFSKKTVWGTIFGIFMLPLIVLGSEIFAFGMLISIIAVCVLIANVGSYAKQISEQFIKIRKKTGQDFSSPEEFGAFDKSVKLWIRKHKFSFAKLCIWLVYLWSLVFSLAYSGNSGTPWWDFVGFLFLLFFGFAINESLSFKDGQGKKIDLLAIWRKRADEVSKQIFNRLDKADRKDKENTKLQKQLDDLKEQIIQEAAAKLETLEKQEAKEIKTMEKLIAEIESETKSLEEISERHPEVQGFLATRTDTSTSTKLIEEVRKKYSL